MLLFNAPLFCELICFNAFQIFSYFSHLLAARIRLDAGLTATRNEAGDSDIGPQRTADQPLLTTRTHR